MTTARKANTKCDNGNRRFGPPERALSELDRRRPEGNWDGNASLTSPAFWAGAVRPSLSTFTMSLDWPKSLVPQRIPALGAGHAWSG